MDQLDKFLKDLINKKETYNKRKDLSEVRKMGLEEIVEEMKDMFRGDSTFKPPKETLALINSKTGTELILFWIDYVYDIHKDKNLTEKSQLIYGHITETFCVLGYLICIDHLKIKK